MEQLPIKIIEIDKDIAYRAARLKAIHSIAFSDCMDKVKVEWMGYGFEIKARFG